MEKKIEELQDEVMREETSKKVQGFWKDNRGVGVIEVVLILVVIFTINMGCK